MKTVFILDADLARHKVMAQHFNSLGFVVRSFFNASEIDEISEKPFLVVLDEKMENKSRTGVQFLKMVSRKVSGAPVVYMVKSFEKKLALEAEKMGAYRVVEKNSAAFVNLRTIIDKLSSAKESWFSRLFSRRQPAAALPALV